MSNLTQPVSVTRAALTRPPPDRGTSSAFDVATPAWDSPTVSTSTVDAEKRVVLPTGRPGDVYDVQRQNERRLLLVRLERPEPGERISKQACLEAMRKAPLRPKGRWEQLRQLTREPWSSSLRG